MKKQYLIIGLLILIVAVAVAMKFGGITGDNGNVDTNTETAEILPVDGDPVEVTMEFYKQWLDAVWDTTTDPYLSGLATSPVISDDVQAKLEITRKNMGIGLDPVLCQSVTPEKIGAKSLSQLVNDAMVMVVARGGDTKSPDQAVVTLGVANGEWQITDITCASGESAPEREFAFDREGFLLKGVPPQLNPDFWYLVFEENGEAGHVAPLSFNASSICISAEGSESACDPNQFINPSKAHVQGGMTESGAVVQRIQISSQD
ncbi:MAG: hypothetical protein ACI92I_000580 [Acidimicrobiales bacterium]|jgi:hypothetical protein